VFPEAIHEISLSLSLCVSPSFSLVLSPSSSASCVPFVPNSYPPPPPSAGASFCAPCTYCGTPQCPADAAAACDRILVVDGGNDGGRCSDSSSWCADVQSKLRGSFAAVDTFDAGAVTGSTPTAAQLAAYDAVFVFGHGGGFAEATLLGDRLAAYHDGGGGVVVAVGANHPAWSSNLRGAYGTPANGYALLDYVQGSSISPADSLGEVLEPQSPLMAGVTSLAAANAHRSTGTVVNGRGVVVARWGGGGQEPLVLRGTKGNRTLVELNFWPVSSSISSSWWTGEGAMLMRNALKYSRCMPCKPGTYVFVGTLGWGGAPRGLGPRPLHGPARALLGCDGHVPVA
jgi:hypothetical protein